MTNADRRRFLTLAAGALAAGAAAPAHAFRQMPMDAATADSLAAACTAATDEHARRRRLLVAANAALPEDRRLSADALEDLVARTACPTCGCPLGRPLPGE
jgi:hypothetical protein